MKRKENIINAILSSAEAYRLSTSTVHELKDEMGTELWYDTIEGHVRLLVDDGLLEQIGVDNSLGQKREKFRLTSQGHKYLRKIQ